MATAHLRYSHRTVVKRSAGRHEHSDLWQVQGITSVNSPFGNGANTWHHEVLAADNLPQVGDQDGDGGLVCVALTPRSTADQGTAEVDVRWQEDPLTLPTEVHYFSSGKVKPAWRGKKVLIPGADPTVAANDAEDVRNTARDRFNPPVTYEAPLERIEIVTRRSLAWHDARDWSQYVKRWNAAGLEILTVDPDNGANTSTRSFPQAGSLYLADKQAPLIKEPYLHRIVKLVFLYDPDLWGVRVANMGPRANFTADNKPDGWAGNWPTTGLCPVIDSYGQPFGGIAELNADGSQMFPSTLTDPTTMPDALVYQWYPVDDDDEMFSADFADLDLFTPERTLNV